MNYKTTSYILFCKILKSELNGLNLFLHLLAPSYENEKKDLAFVFQQFYFILYCICMVVCLFVCLCPINDRTAKPIESKYIVGPRVTQGKVYEWRIFKNLPLKKFDFWKFWKSAKYFFYKMGGKRLKILVYISFNCQTHRVTHKG